MNQKSSLRKILQFVSQALTANKQVTKQNEAFRKDINRLNDAIAELREDITKRNRDTKSNITRVPAFLHGSK